MVPKPVVGGFVLSYNKCIDNNREALLMKNNFGTCILFWLGAIVVFNIAVAYRFLVLVVGMVSFIVNPSKTKAGLKAFSQKIQNLYHGSASTKGAGQAL